MSLERITWWRLSDRERGGSARRTPAGSSLARHRLLSRCLYLHVVGEQSRADELSESRLTRTEMPQMCLLEGFQQLLGPWSRSLPSTNLSTIWSCCSNMIASSCNGVPDINMLKFPASLKPCRLIETRIFSKLSLYSTLGSLFPTPSQKFPSEN